MGHVDHVVHPHVEDQLGVDGVVALQGGLYQVDGSSVGVAEGVDRPGLAGPGEMQAERLGRRSRWCSDELPPRWPPLGKTS